MQTTAKRGPCLTHQPSLVLCVSCCCAAATPPAWARHFPFHVFSVWPSGHPLDMTGLGVPAKGSPFSEPLFPGLAWGRGVPGSGGARKHTHYSFCCTSSSHHGATLRFARSREPWCAQCLPVYPKQSLPAGFWISLRAQPGAPTAPWGPQGIEEPMGGYSHLNEVSIEELPRLFSS